MSNDRISQLEKQIRLANEAYAKGQPFMTDEEYHEIWRELRSLDPLNKNLFHTSRDPNYVNKVPHSQRVLSLNKALNSDDLKYFFHRFKDLKTFRLEPKLDGIALILYAQSDSNGKLSWKAVTSGDGDHGDDISWILPHCNSVPSPRNELPKISCEAVIPWKDWDSSLGANPRNVVAGLLNPKRTSIGDALSRVSIIPHTYEGAEINVAKPEEIENLLLEYFHLWNSDYPIDGIVVKVHDKHRRLQAGHNQQYPLWAIAWKPPIQTARTTVRAIHWNVSRAGRVIPKVEFEPVSLCGTVNRFATANNAEWIFEREIIPDSEIVVGKAGEIIPQILELVRSPGIYDLEIGPLRECPSCGGQLRWEGVHLVCQSSSCWPQLIKRLSHFYGFFGMDLKGIGDSMIEELLEDEDSYQILRDSPWALLDPENFGLTPFMIKTWGHTRTQNFMNSLEEVNHSKNPAHFMSGLGLPGLGYKTALAFLQEMQGHKVFKKSPTNEAVHSFHSAVESFSQAIEGLKNFKFAPIPEPASITYCITGTLPIPRNEAIEELSQYGWKHISSVSKNLNYLILGDLDKESKKFQKAKELGIKILEPYQLPIFKEDQND